jgi:hypothetical protein
MLISSGHKPQVAQRQGEHTDKLSVAKWRQIGIWTWVELQEAKIHTLINSKNVLHTRSLSSIFHTLLDLLDRASLPWRHHTKIFSQCTPCTELFFYHFFPCVTILSLLSLIWTIMVPWGHKLRILCGIYLPDIFYSLSTKSGWEVVNVPNLLHGFERILVSLTSYAA